MSIPPLPCSLRALALNAEDPRFVRTGGFPVFSARAHSEQGRGLLFDSI